jgi:hypothetical protein
MGRSGMVVPSLSILNASDQCVLRASRPLLPCGLSQPFGLAPSADDVRALPRSRVTCLSGIKAFRTLGKPPYGCDGSASPGLLLGPSRIDVRLQLRTDSQFASVGTVTAVCSVS